ncbi:MAG: DUF2095 family protein [Promethearchaeota archaeon]
MERDNKENKVSKNIKIENKEGLTISYNEKEFQKRFPYLKKEMSDQTKSIKIDSIEEHIELDNIKESHKSNNHYPNELYNPRAIDFIRRCTKKEDAIIILDYLMKRKEISEEDYNAYKNAVSEEGGLERLINESGGLKRPGYYMRKYYKKEIKNQKLNNNED